MRGKAGQAAVAGQTLNETLTQFIAYTSYLRMNFAPFPIWYTRTLL